MLETLISLPCKTSYFSRRANDAVALLYGILVTLIWNISYGHYELLNTFCVGLCFFNFINAVPVALTCIVEMQFLLNLPQQPFLISLLGRNSEKKHQQLNSLSVLVVKSPISAAPLRLIIERNLYIQKKVISRRTRVMVTRNWARFLKMFSAKKNLTFDLKSTVLKLLSLSQNLKDLYIFWELHIWMEPMPRFSFIKH